jgi:hypothetical protein
MISLSLSICTLRACIHAYRQTNMWCVQLVMQTFTQKHRQNITHDFYSENDKIKFLISLILFDHSRAYFSLSLQSSFLSRAFFLPSKSVTNFYKIKTIFFIELRFFSHNFSAFAYFWSLSHRFAHHRASPISRNQLSHTLTWLAVNNAPGTCMIKSIFRLGEKSVNKWPCFLNNNRCCTHKMLRDCLSALTDSLTLLFGRLFGTSKVARDKNRVPYMVNNRADCLVY